MKIYTRKGDKGETGLLGGKRIMKSHLRIDSYGTLDELNSFLGLLRDQKEVAGYFDTIIGIQNQLFSMGSHLAAQSGKSFDYLPKLDEEQVIQLEEAIDKMNKGLPEMKYFVLPGGHPTISYCHVARCVCRRAERLVVRLKETEEVDGIIIKYLNRLSDYLFVLSRRIAHDSGIREVPWKPRE